MLYSIEKKTDSEIKIKRSRFVAVLYPLPYVEEVKDILNEHYRLFSDATQALLRKLQTSFGQWNR